MKDIGFGVKVLKKSQYSQNKGFFENFCPKRAQKKCWHMNTST
jgi:hypothetical protein